ncbi:MAG: nucleotide exchange factor GrpE [Myxococcota bacterium]
MSETVKKKSTTPDEAAAQTADDSQQDHPDHEAADSCNSNDAAADQPQPSAPPNALQQLQQQFDALNDKHLRLAAEFDNYKRRSSQQQQQQLQYANEPLIRDLLPCLDHLQRALQASKQALQNSNHPSLGTLLDGLDMVHKQLLETLQRFGVTWLQPVGQPFDPNQHEAVSQQEHTQPPGTVLQLLQAGYMLHERLLRPARVVVAKASDSSNNGS